ncbi:MAG: hypothetical protein JXB47_20890 [Anaerolineae bacterium]|nr:hypothetical protein [Anaerolineae bacterium]
MSSSRCIPLAEAQRVAGALVELLAPACARVEVAGSVRRGAATVGDIEIVAVGLPMPRLEFGKPIPTQTPLERLLNRLDAEYKIAKRKRWGPKFKQLYYRNCPVDLFVVPAEEWGAAFVIRTGPAAFSRLLVTPRAQGGAMPGGMRQRDNRLWRGGAALATPEEADYFAALGLPVIAPAERTVARLKAEVRKAPAREAAGRVA